MIQDFYEEHPLLFQVTVLPFELLIGVPAGITLGYWIIGLFSNR